MAVQNADEEKAFRRRIPIGRDYAQYGIPAEPGSASTQKPRLLWSHQPKASRTAK
jgi:hypothetical protein